MAIGPYRTAVVTGGASGIGRSCALAFAREGCDLAIADLHEARLAEVAAEIEAFVPRMRAAGRGHVIVTASIAGRYAYSYDAGPYIASKFAAYGYSENLALYLRPQGVNVSVLCPGLVLTNLGENAERAGVESGAAWGHFPEWMLRPITADDVAPLVVDAVRTNRFLIYTHPEDEVLIRERSADVDAALAAQIARLPDPAPPTG